MLFGQIRWDKSLGTPVGDAATGFRVLAEEHTANRLTWKLRQNNGARG
jgi:hypothetical protein